MLDFRIYLFGLAGVAGMPFIGIGNRPSAWFVNAMKSRIALTGRVDGMAAFVIGLSMIFGPTMS